MRELLCSAGRCVTSWGARDTSSHSPCSFRQSRHSRQLHIAAKGDTGAADATADAHFYKQAAASQDTLLQALTDYIGGGTIAAG